MPMRGGARQTPRILGTRGLVEEAPKGQGRGMCLLVNKRFVIHVCTRATTGLETCFHCDPGAKVQG